MAHIFKVRLSILLTVGSDPLVVSWQTSWQTSQSKQVRGVKVLGIVEKGVVKAQEKWWLVGVGKGGGQRGGEVLG